MSSHVFVFKVLREAEFWQFHEERSFSGSSDDLRDGYIHLSFEEQLAGTLAKHFQGEAELYICRFRRDDLGTALKLEGKPGGSAYPHLYGKLEYRHLLDFQKRIPLPVEARYPLETQSPTEA